MSEIFSSYITVSDMARVVGLSRSRFYSLIGSVFPEPIMSEYCGRRFYDAELQRQCLEVRKNNRGVNGLPIFFQTKSLSPVKSSKRTVKPKVSKHESILCGLVALGLSGIAEKQVEQAILACFPEGIIGVDEEMILRNVFVKLSNSLSG